MKGKALIIKENEPERVYLHKMLLRFGMEVMPTSTAEEGILLASQEDFDIVFCNIYLSRISAPELIRQLKQVTAPRLVPIVMIVNTEEVNSLHVCFSSGADAFIQKPFNLSQVKATILALLKNARLHNELQKEKALIERHCEAEKKDMQDADEILHNMRNEMFQNAKYIEWKYIGLNIFSGDMLCSTKNPNNDHLFFVGDNTGHGLAPAIGSIVSNDIFYAMAKKGFRINQIAEEINSKLYHYLPSNRFLACCLMKLSADFSGIEILNAGLPDVMILNAAGQIKQKVSSSHVPLGVMATHLIQLEIVNIKLDEGDRVLCFTDGVPESFNQDNESYGYDRLYEVVNQYSQEMGFVEAIYNDIESFIGDSEQHDDITMLGIHCSKKYIEKSLPKKQEVEYIKPMNWDLRLCVDHEMLKTNSPMPILLDAVSEIQGFLNHRENLFMIMTEMFSNALEHGLLKLDSSIKEEVNGFEKYYNLRQERLQNLKDGFIEFTLSHQSFQDHGMMVISLSDSGDGFDYKNILSLHERHMLKSGRGIKLISELCKSITYRDQGRTMQVEYEWQYSETPKPLLVANG